MQREEHDWGKFFRDEEEEKVKTGPDWVEEPVDFKTFIESEDFSDHFALSELQYVEIMKLFGNDPKKIFDKDNTREYKEAVFCWERAVVREPLHAWFQTTLCIFFCV